MPLVAEPKKWESLGFSAVKSAQGQIFQCHGQAPRRACTALRVSIRAPEHAHQHKPNLISGDLTPAQLCTPGAALAKPLLFQQLLQVMHPEAFQRWSLRACCPKPQTSQ